MEKQASFTYAPSRWKGILFLTFCCALLAGFEIWLLRHFNLSQVSLQFFLMLIALIILAVPLFFLMYRLYSLIFSYYRLKRDGLHIRWGMRSEIIPLNAIEWIRSPQEMTEDVPWSVLPMPGAYLGTVKGGSNATYEFLASDMGNMLFLGTSRYIYVISPRSTSNFLTGFERILQMGALSNIEWSTVRPGSWLIEAWENKPGRICTVASLVMLIALYIFVGTRFQVMGGMPITSFQMQQPQGESTAVSMMAIPLTATVIWVAGTILGLRVFQQKENRRTAELVWAAVSAAVLQCLIGAIMAV